LLFALKVTKKSVHLRELGKSLQVKLNSVYKHAYRELGNKLVLEGRLPEADLLYFLTHEEAGVLSCVPLAHPDLHRLRTRALQRRRLHVRQSQLKFPELSQGKPQPLVPSVSTKEAKGSIQGTAVSSGMARGKARICRSLEDAEFLQEGEILITPQTDVGWTPYFSVAAGLVTEIGGMLSHGAVVAREYSLPCVVGITDACDKIRTGTVVELDGDRGVLRVVEQE
jgi:pyruvate,water dikinase